MVVRSKSHRYLMGATNSQGEREINFLRCISKDTDKLVVDLAKFPSGLYSLVSRKFAPLAIYFYIVLQKVLLTCFFQEGAKLFWERHRPLPSWLQPAPSLRNLCTTCIETTSFTDLSQKTCSESILSINQDKNLLLNLMRATFSSSRRIATCLDLPWKRFERDDV